MNKKSVSLLLAITATLSLTACAGTTPTQDTGAAEPTAVVMSTDEASLMSLSTQPQTFTDVEGHWAKEAIETAVASGWFAGTSSTTFSPDAFLNRGMFITVLGRIAGVPTDTVQTVFTDVPASAYYAPYVSWAYENGITHGVTSDTFAPDRSITRQEMAVMLYAFANQQEVTLPSGDSKDFADASKISAWAVDAVNAMTAAGIINGKDGNLFDPAGTATRAEAATVLVRYSEAVYGNQDNTSNTGSLNTNSGYQISRASLEHLTENSDAPVVYYTSEISSDALLEIYNALGREATGNVAVKLSTGEAGNNNYLDPDLIKALVQSVNGTIVECNTAYGGSRAETALHRQVIADHGFNDIATVDIMDEEGSISLPVDGGSYLTEDLVGSHLANYDFVMVLSHFKGHSQGGFGGALKNISIGIASSEGKNMIHTAGESHESWIPFDNFRFMSNEGEDHNNFIRSMAEAAKAVSDYEGHGEQMLYISVMNHLSVDCDCVGNPAEATMHDVAILASTDPVALDQACVDIVYAAPDGADVIERIESRNGTLILEHAEEIGLGSRSYRLIDMG